MSIFRVWIPGEKGYKEHLDRVFIGGEQVAAVKEQTTELRDSLRRASAASSEQTTNLIASNEQLISAVDRGFDRLAEINTRGFSQVTSAVQDLQSDMNYLLGTVIQQLEYQSKLLNGILATLQQPFETQVKELYNNGCKFIRQDNLEAAIECFRDSISLKMGKYFFPSHFQLGRLYLSGKSKDLNVVDPKMASEYLSKAAQLGDGIIKEDDSFRPVLADCKLFLSQSMFYQLNGKTNSAELSLINSAIRYCEESVQLNPKLSQGYYHLAKYHAFRMKVDPSFLNDTEIENVLIAFLKAVEIDRNYLRAVIERDTTMYDPALEHIREHVTRLITRLTDIKRKEATILLQRAQGYIAQLDHLNTLESSKYSAEFRQLKAVVQSSQTDFRSDTYFGFDDCLAKLETL